MVACLGMLAAQRVCRNTKHTAKQIACSDATIKSSNADIRKIFMEPNPVNGQTQTSHKRLKKQIKEKPPSLKFPLSFDAW